MLPKIVISVNKNDLWFCRICIASIRYFYPDITIILVKDYLKGSFCTREIESLWNVNIYKSNIRYYGWGAAKTHFLANATLGEKFLILDSDIIFLGPFLERLFPLYSNNDILVSAEFTENPYSEWVKKTYFDTREIEKFDSEYKYPGFFFNTGQLFITGGAINPSDLVNYFDTNQFPLYTKMDLFPLVDQSLYNYLFIKLNSKKKLSLAKDSFMIWSETQEFSHIDLLTIVNRQNKHGLVHFAGAKRNPSFKPMSNKHLLIYFQNYYYTKVKYSKLKLFIRIQKFRIDKFIDRFLTFLNNKLIAKK